MDYNVFTPRSFAALTDLQQDLLKQTVEANKKVTVEVLNTAKNVAEIYVQSIDTALKALTRT